jgi:tetratricopeptide (TPR) repeat protein
MMKLRQAAAALTLGLLLAPAALWSADKKDPQIKSPKEGEAFKAIQTAATDDARLKAINDMLTNFADTELKVILLQMAMQIEETKNDYAQTTFYGERVLEADPKNPFATVTLASQIVKNTREFDLDKEEKLGKADKYAHQALDAIADYPKPFSQMPDAAWTSQKRDVAAEAHGVLAQMAILRKKYDAAIVEYKSAIDANGSSTMSYYDYLGNAYLKAGKPDEAAAAFEKVLSSPDAPAQAKTFAETGKADAAKLKAGGGAQKP